jgi:glycosyltransferase involved in cell wall biosynthesis
VSRVSVVIPVFNREKFIRQTIESVLAQSYRDFEIIAVDDGSRDGSRAILESFADSVRVLEHPGRANRGQSASINLGLRQARGELIAVLDSDDLWLPQKLAIQVAYLDSHPDVGLVYGNGWMVDETGARRYAIYGPEHRELSDASRVLLDCYFHVPGNALVRAEVLRKVGGFDETLRAAQDHDMAIRIAEVTRLAYIDSHLWCYRRHGDSISLKSADVRWRNGFLILDKARRRYPYSKGTLRRRRAVLHFRAGQCDLRARRWLRAASNFIAAAALDPRRVAGVLLGHERVSPPN